MDIVRRPGIPATPESTVPAAAAAVPAQISGHGSDAQETWLEFFAAQVRNPNTRTASARAAYRLFDWLGEHGVTDVREIRPAHIAAWLTVCQVVTRSPAAAVRGRWCAEPWYCAAESRPA